MSHLSRFLEEHNVLYPEQLAEAVRRQQIYGGSLDTVLLELELVAPQDLGALLEKACGFPAAPPNLLVGRHKRPWDQIPEDLQRSRWVEPLAMDRNEVLVAVHPDLPNDLLGGLLRNVRRMRPMVTPECCLEKVAAERHGSVVPQRYAILSAAYLAAVRRPPVVRTPAAEPEAGVSGSIDVHEAEPVDAPDGTPPSAEERRRRNTMVAAAPPVTPRGTLVSLTAPVGPDSGPVPAASGKADDPAPPAPSPDPPTARTEPERASGPTPQTGEWVPEPPATSAAKDKDAAASPASDPEPTQVMPPLAPPPERDEADLRRRLEQARRTVADASSRDEAIAALIGGATILSPRAGLFRVRGYELVGLSSPGSALTELGGATVALNVGSAADEALREGHCVAPAADADLRVATRVPKDTPCALWRIDVRGRPVLVLYLDRDGRPIDDLDREGLAALAGAAGEVFEAIVRKRRAKPSGPTPATTESAAPASSKPEAGATPAATWGPVSPRVRAAYGDGSTGAEPAPVEASSTARVEVADGSAVPPPPAVAAPSETPHDDWRLTPELAAQALIREPGSGSGAHPAATDEDADVDDPPANLEDEGIPIRPLSHDVSGPMRIDLRAEVSGPHVAAPEPRATLEDEELPAPPSSSGVREVTGEREAIAERRTLSMSGLGIPVDDDDHDDFVAPPEPQPESTKPAPEATAAAAAPDEPEPSAPIPPPPPSAVDESDRASRRRKGSTISGLPPPELKGRDTAQKRKVVTPPAELPRGDEDVEIIPLARPITPTTARGRIELEEEDWMPTGAPLAADGSQAEIDAAIDQVLAGDREVETLLEHGNPALLRLMAQFPGHLEVMRRDLRSLPPPSAHGPLIRAVIALGEAIVPHVIDLLSHPNPDVRFYAAFVFHELRDERCMSPLAKLAFDGNADVRVVSMRVLETYRRRGDFDTAAAVVRQQLTAQSRQQQLHAARAAGTLRDIGSIPELIELLASGDRFIQEASLESLCSITGQQHGLKPHRWRNWYADQGDLHRVEWIIDSLRHRDLPVRRWAADELVRITGHRVPFSPMGDKRAREVAAKAWTEWWTTRGRAMFGV